MFRVHTAKDLLGIVAGILDGEIRRTAGDLNGAIAAFQRAAGLQAALVYDEPEPLPFSAFHWLGAALVESASTRPRRPTGPNYRITPTTAGRLACSRRSQVGDPSQDVDGDLASSWSRADTWIRSSRF